MKKRVLSILLVAAMTASLAACGGSDSSNNSASGSGEITLTIPTFCVGENVGAVYFEPAVERFNEANKGKYHIELEEVVEASYTDKISQLAQSDSLPTLIQTPDIEWIKKEELEVALGFYVYINEMSNDFLDEHPEIKELCVDSSLEYCTLENGDIISVPAVTLSNTGLYYNSALYSPEKTVSSMTMDEFISSLGDNKFALQTVDNAWTSALLLTALIANEDGGKEWLQSNEGTKCYDYTEPAFVNAVTKLNRDLENKCIR